MGYMMILYDRTVRTLGHSSLKIKIWDNGISFIFVSRLLKRSGTISSQCQSHDCG